MHAHAVQQLLSHNVENNNSDTVTLYQGDNVPFDVPVLVPLSTNNNTHAEMDDDHNDTAEGELKEDSPSISPLTYLPSI
jgi:hypothetical protein